MVMGEELYWRLTAKGLGVRDYGTVSGWLTLKWLVHDERQAYRAITLDGITGMPTTNS